jgi:hypothetical protein
MYRREHRHQLSFEDFFLPFGGKLSGDNRWIKLAELIPWDELEDDYAAQFCKGFGAPAKPFRMAPGALIIVCVQGSRCAAAGLHADRASLSNQWAVLPVAALREPAAVMASARRGDKRSRPAPGMPRHHGPVV